MCADDMCNAKCMINTVLMLSDVTRQKNKQQVQQNPV